MARQLPQLAHEVPGKPNLCMVFDVGNTFGRDRSIQLVDRYDLRKITSFTYDWTDADLRDTKEVLNSEGFAQAMGRAEKGGF